MKAQRLLLILFALLSLSACNSSNEKIAPDEEKDMQYKVALFYNLSGEQGPLGLPASKGSKLAFDSLLTNYPILSTSVGYIFFDGHSDPDRIRRQAKEIGRSDVVGALGFTDDSMLLAAAPEIKQAKKIFVSSGATSPLLPQEAADYVFLVAFGDNAQAAAAAEYAYDTMNLTRACILYNEGSDYTNLLDKYFKESFTSWGGQIVAEQKYPMNASNIRMQLQAFKKASPPPDVIYLAALPNEASSLIKEIRFHGFTQPIFGGDSFDTHELLQSDTELNDIYFTTHVMLDAQTTNPQITKFVNTYIAAYNEYPASAFAALGYDAANLLFEAIKTAGSFKYEDILKSFAQIKNFPGVTGTISYSEDNHVPVKPITMIEVKDSRRYFKGSFIPQRIPPP